MTKRRPGAKRGRPVKSAAKRKQSDRAGRRGDVDRGTSELRRHRRNATGSPELPLDSLGVLLGRGIITLAEYHAGRDVAELLEVSRRALGLGNGGAHSVWLAILAGGRMGGSLQATAVEWALRVLAKLQQRIGDPRAVMLVFAVAQDELPGDLLAPGAVDLLRYGLDRVARSWTSRASTILTRDGADRLTCTPNIVSSSRP